MEYKEVYVKQSNGDYKVEKELCHTQGEIDAMNKSLWSVLLFPLSIPMGAINFLSESREGTSSSELSKTEEYMGKALMILLFSFIALLVWTLLSSIFQDGILDTMYSIVVTSFEILWSYFQTIGLLFSLDGILEFCKILILYPVVVGSLFGLTICAVSNEYKGVHNVIGAGIIIFLLVAYIVVPPLKFVFEII